MMKFLVVFLLLFSINTLAAESVNDPKLLDFNKFNYLGIKFSDSVGQVQSKGFSCEATLCKKYSADTKIDVAFREGVISSISSNETYTGNSNCVSDITDIKNFLVSKYNIQLKDIRELVAVMPPITRPVSDKFEGVISTTTGKFDVSVNCLTDVRVNRYYIQSKLSFKDMGAQRFKNGFQYE